MPQTRWQRVEELFLAAADLEPEARRAFLIDACSEEDTLRAEVEGMLSADSAEGDQLAHAVAKAASDFTDQLASALVGSRVGAYRLVSVIGHGGMGTVYLAERADDAYRASVAIKFVRGVLAAPDHARRLVAERQFLADLNHPGIARLLDGGATTDGTPYLVLEYVDGVHIDTWCDAHALGVRERVELFLRVCDAVHYAHNAKVVHRDLKPSNILVASDGTPKLVDFGIAKLLGGDGGSETTTDFRALTPAYASPEQVRGEPVSVGSDVYSLGVVLYRLLAGRLPFDLSGASAGEVERRICREVAPAPSRAVQEHDSAWRVEIMDLDPIISRALRKRVDQRYSSVAALADDLRRWLAAPRRRHALRRAWAGIGTTARAGVLVTASAVVVGAIELAAYADDVAFELLPVQEVIPPVRAPYRVVHADVNGDGRYDLVWNHATDSINEFAVGLAQSNGTFVMQQMVRHSAPVTSWQDFQLLTGNFNGDARDDLAWNRAGKLLANVVYFGFSIEDGSFLLRDSLYLSWSGNRWATGWKVQVGDVNGDQVDDLVFNFLAEQNVLRVFPVSRDSVYPEIGPLTHFGRTWSGYRAFVADVNGDGLDDVAWNDVPVWANRTYVARSAADRIDLLAHQDHEVTNGWQGFTTVVADIHGDGIHDMVWTRTHGDSLSVFVASGQPSSVFRYEALQTFRVPGAADLSGPAVGDFNGDGRDDLLWRAGTQLWVMTGTKSGTLGIRAVAGAPTGDLGGFEMMVSDVDGDALDDLVWVERDGSRVYVARAG